MSISPENSKNLHHVINSVTEPMTPTDFSWRKRPRDDDSPTAEAAKIAETISDMESGDISWDESLGDFDVPEGFLLLNFDDNFNNSIRQVYSDFMCDRLEVQPPSVALKKKKSKPNSSVSSSTIKNNLTMRQIYANFSRDSSGVPAAFAAPPKRAFLPSPPPSRITATGRNNKCSRVEMKAIFDMFRATEQVGGDGDIDTPLPVTTQINPIVTQVTFDDEVVVTATPKTIGHY